MSIDQFIESQLNLQARRALGATRDWARELIETVAAYRRAFDTAREFRRGGG